MADITWYIKDGADIGASMVASSAANAPTIEVPDLVANNTVTVRIVRVDGAGNVLATTGVSLKVAIGVPGTVDVSQDTWTAVTTPDGHEGTLDMTTAFDSAMTAALAAGNTYLDRYVEVKRYISSSPVTLLLMPVRIQAGLIAN